MSVWSLPLVLTSLLLASALPQAVATLVGGATAAATQAPPPATPEAAAQAVLRRVIGETNAASFVFALNASLHRETSAGPQHSKVDSFTVVATGGTVHVQGPTGVSLTAGAYWYLKHVAGCIVTWGEHGTGDQVALPAPLPDVAATTTSMIVPWRYAWNMCTLDYSMAWWNASRWQREIDWAALHGVNLPLAITGQEYVWTKLLLKRGLTLAELEDWFTGPAFLAWQRAGNIRKFAGPLSQQFMADQAALQQFILGEMRALGMTPVLPCFSGHVPKAVQRLYPNATLTQSPPWNHFSPAESDVYMIDPTQDAFKELGAQFMKAIIEEYGASHFYSCDTFNEVDPTSTSATYLAAASRSVVESIQAADPEGVWVMQAWLFHFGFWTYDRVKAYLSGVNNTSMLILDLNSEVVALAPKYDQYFGKPWIWNMLHNYGGVRGMYGNLTRIATGPLEDLHRANSTMIGIGFTPEAIEQNPVMYEMLTSTFYASKPIEVTPWLRDYVKQRYGGVAAGTPVDAGKKLEGVWQTLFRAVYNQPKQPRTELEHIPTWESPNYGWQNGNPELMMQAAEEMLAATLAVPNYMANGPLQYDFVDIWRQASTMFFTDAHRLLVTELNNVNFGGGSVNSTVINGQMNLMLDLIQTIDDLYGTNPNYQLGLWTSRATSLATSESEASLFLYNAKNQITLWGPDGQITDYASKAWMGLYSTYYYNRWLLMFNYVKQIGVRRFNVNTFRQDVLLPWEQQWCNDSSQTFSPTPSGADATAIAQRLHSLTAGNLSQFTVQSNMAGGSALSYSTFWTKRPEQLAKLCDMTPRCNAFSTSSGMLYGEASSGGYEQMYVKKTKNA